MRPIVRMWLVLLGTAALSLTTILGALDDRLGVILAGGFAVYIALTAWPVLAGPSDGRGRARDPRSFAPVPGAVSGGAGLVALSAAGALALADRHLVVASRGVAPDDVAVALLSAVCLVLAVRAPQLAGRPFVTGLALAAYALIFVSLIGGTTYHSDAVANVHRATELVLAGADPYRSVDTFESLDRFGIDRAFATHLEDGTALRTLNYPPLSFLLPAPAVALGLADLRVLYAVLLLIATLAATALSAARWRPYVLASVIGNVVIARQYVLAGIDPSWAILLGASLVVLARAGDANRRWLVLSAVLLGLAAASRQPSWFAVPFAIDAVVRGHGLRAGIRYGALALLAFIAPALPFLIAAPQSYVSGILAPILLPLEPHGIGLVRLGTDGVLPLLSRGAYTALAVAALIAAFFAARYRRPSPAGLPAVSLAPLYVGWRALQNYFAFGGVFAMLAIADDDVRAGRRLSPEGEVPDAGR
jgi:hypothetical protein